MRLNMTSHKVVATIDKGKDCSYRISLMAR